MRDCPVEDFPHDGEREQPEQPLDKPRNPIAVKPASPLEFISGLFTQGDNKMSIGKFITMASFTISVYFWFTRAPELFPESLTLTLQTSLIYALGGKVSHEWGRRGPRE